MALVNGQVFPNSKRNTRTRAQLGFVSKCEAFAKKKSMIYFDSSLGNDFTDNSLLNGDCQIGNCIVDLIV